MCNQVIWYRVSKKQGLAKSLHHNFIFQRRGTHIWHQVLNIDFCIARVCDTLEHALARRKILIDSFPPNMVYKGDLSWGIQGKGCYSVPGNEKSKIGNANGKCANIGESQ